MKRAPLATALALMGLTFGHAAHSSQSTGHDAHRAGFIAAADFGPVRAGRTLQTQATQSLRSKADAHYGSGWTIAWDTDTGIPTRIYGEGRSFPGTVADSESARVAAEGVLAEQIALLAPGSAASDFELIANIENAGVRMVTFAQHHRGVRVLGATIGFRFKADRLIVIASEAMPNVVVDELASPLPGFAASAAAGWIASELNIDSVASGVGEAVIVPLIAGPGRISYRAALPVELEARSSIGEWTVYVGADERVIGRISKIHFAEGTVRYNTPDRWPGDTRSDYPAPFANQTVDGQPQLSDGDGLVTFPGATASIDTGLTGSFVTIQNQDGNSTTNLTLNDGASTTWTGGDADELIDAQLTVFIHANIAIEHAKVMAPALAILNQPLPALVNRTGNCNAFASGSNINFFVRIELTPTLNCENTGRLPDVIYHEFGHYFHINTINQTGANFDSAFSEGLSDYYAASITNDSAMGRGFFRTEDPLRPIDGPGGDIYWPQANWNHVDTHYTGVVFAGAMWDLRLALIAELGEGPGDQLADKLFYGAVQRASSVDTTYVEVLTEDDDDGNLMNGTPNKCTIDYAFGTHGFGPARSVLGEGLELHSRDGHTISIAEKTPASGCPAPPVGSIELFWRLRSDATVSGTVPMPLSGGAYAGTIPTQPEGEVIEYRITVAYADGNVRRLPLNFSRTFYEFFNGDVEEIYCSDFENDPMAEGWGSVGFEHGAPNGGETNTDPDAAFSGTNVFGTQLAGDGAYPDLVAATLLSPEIDVSGHENVRLQFQRWLNVSDGQIDRATIRVNDVPLYTNFAGEFLFLPEQHLDHEWKFTDLDIDGQTAGGTVRVGFDLNGNVNSGPMNPPFQGNTLGGWTIDDFCVVSFVRSECGDGETTGNEECDDGAANSDTDPDVCRADCTAALCGDGVADTNEECDDGNGVDEDDCSNTCVDLSSGGGCGCESSSSGGPASLVLLGLMLVAIGRRRRSAGSTERSSE